MIEFECDYLLMPITGSDLVSFDSNPSDYSKYILEHYGSGWVYLYVDYWNDTKCLVYKKDI